MIGLAQLICVLWRLWCNWISLRKEYLDIGLVDILGLEHDVKALSILVNARRHYSVHNARGLVEISSACGIRCKVIFSHHGCYSAWLLHIDAQTKPVMDVDFILVRSDGRCRHCRLSLGFEHFIQIL